MMRSPRRVGGTCYLQHPFPCFFRKVISLLSKENGNQKPFEKMIIMKYDCVGIGVVKMTVGVRRRTHEKVQYCITALEI